PHIRDAVDVACDANRRWFGEPNGPNPADPAGDPGPQPYYGSPCVVKGGIYPQGTLDAHCDPTDPTAALSQRIANRKVASKWQRCDRAAMSLETSRAMSMGTEQRNFTRQVAVQTPS